MNYKFLDIGCKTGSSFSIGESFGYTKDQGLGIDINKHHIAAAQEKGYNAMKGDITKTMPFDDGHFELVIANHVMEHLPSKGLFLLALDEMIRLSSKHVFISFPVFDHNEYLKTLGLKTFYSDWTGHTCMFHLSELKERLSDHAYDVKMIKLLKDSSAKEIHSINSPKDQHEFDPSIHPPKPFVIFDREIYREFRLIITK